MGIRVERGVTQGDVDSPIIFNLIIDVVLRRMKGDIDFGNLTMSFYADDGLVENSDPRKLQRDMDEMVGLFAKFGLGSAKADATLNALSSSKRILQQVKYKHIDTTTTTLINNM